MYVEFMKNFSLADTSEQMASSAYWLLDIISADWSELMAVRFISDWAQKRLIPTF